MKTEIAVDRIDQVDHLGALLDRFKMRAQLFHSGRLCDITRFDAKPGRGFLHVLRQGEMRLVHHAKSGLPRRLLITEPSLFFYPQPITHEFQSMATDGTDFTCAVVEFENGRQHPLVKALPPLVLLPLAKVSGLEQSLSLLFSEAGQVHCGQSLLVDRLFEVVLIQLLRWLIAHPEDGGISTGLLMGLADQRLSKALVAMHEAPGQAWNLESMAQEAGMSRSGFAARFKEIVEETPADYLSNWRLSIAQNQLLKGRPLKLIADELAYANASALSRMFTQKLGMSPTTWLKQMTK